MTKYLKIAGKQIAIAVSEFTDELLTAQQACSMVRECSYQVISGCLEGYTHLQTIEVLLALLPLSNHRLIDVVLPFLAAPHDAPLLARYILFENKLRGIRVCSNGMGGNGQWPLGRCEHWAPPAEVQRYYRERLIAYRQDEVLVGVFCLQLLRCRVGLLFMSEIIENGALLDIPHKYQYDILSVTADLPRHTQPYEFGYRQKEAISKLKVLAQETMLTVVHAGIRTVPALNKYYNEKSFIAQARVETQGKAYLGERTATTFLCNIDLTLTKRLESPLDSEETMFNEADVIEGLYINRSLKYYQQVPEQKVSAPIVLKRYFNEIPNDKELLLMHLWFLFRTVNQGSPFVLPYPFSPRCRQLYLELIKLEQYALISKEELIKIYRYKQGDSQVQVQLRVYPDFSQMVDSNTNLFPGLIYVYADDDEEIKSLRNGPKYGSRVCNCDPVNPYVDPPPTNTKEESLSNLQKRKVEQACNNVLRERVKTIDEMLASFAEMNFSKAEVEHAFVDELPKKIKKAVKPMAIHYFLLHSSKQKIINEIGEAEFRLNQQLKSKPTSKEDTALRNFREKIERARKYKLRLSSQVECHRCQVSFSKELVHSCGKCEEWLCFECIDALTNRTLTSLEDYRCALCNKVCRCGKCTGEQPVSTMEIESEKPKPQQHPENSSEKSQDTWALRPRCQICHIFNDKCKDIMFQCDQCKKLSCYFCMKKEGDNTPFEQDEIIICKNCEKFNNAHAAVILNPIPTAQIQIPPAPVQETKPDIKELKKNDLPPLVETPKKKRQNLEVKQLQYSSNKKKKQSPKKVRKFTLQKKTRKSRSPSSSSGSSSSDSRPKRRRSKSNSRSSSSSSSSSSSRSRSRSRSNNNNRRNDKKSSPTKQRMEKKAYEHRNSRQKELNLERAQSKNSQKPLWGKPEVSSHHDAPRQKRISEQPKGMNWQPRANHNANNHSGSKGSTNYHSNAYSHNSSRPQKDSIAPKNQNKNNSSASAQKAQVNNVHYSVIFPPQEEGDDFQQMSY